MNLGVQQAVERKADMRLRGLRLPDGRAAQLVSGELAQLNAVTDPTQLRLGQVLHLPESVREPRTPVVPSACASTA